MHSTNRPIQYNLAYFLTAVLLLLPLLAYATPELDERRVALVIGNQDYQQEGASLQRPIADAESMAAILRKHQFELLDDEVHKNLNKQEMETVFQRFQQAASGVGEAVVYYAGHGTQEKGANYLIPVDAEINDSLELPYKAVELQLLLDRLKEAGARVNLVFLDACRDNPFGNNRSGSSRGLARVATQNTETLISYSTASGKTANDESPYTPALVGWIQQHPTMNIEMLLKKVGASVKEKSHGEQQPDYVSSLTTNFCFSGCDDDGAIEAADLPGEPVSMPATPPEPEKTLKNKMISWAIFGAIGVAFLVLLGVVTLDGSWEIPMFLMNLIVGGVAGGIVGAILAVTAWMGSWWAVLGAIFGFIISFSKGLSDVDFSHGCFLGAMGVVLGGIGGAILVPIVWAVQWAMAYW
jgi:hypothetical protein